MINKTPITAIFAIDNSCRGGPHCTQYCNNHCIQYVNTNPNKSYNDKSRSIIFLCDRIRFNTRLMKTNSIAVIILSTYMMTFECKRKDVIIILASSLSVSSFPLVSVTNNFIAYWKNTICLLSFPERIKLCVAGCAVIKKDKKRITQQQQQQQ